MDRDSPQLPCSSRPPRRRWPLRDRCRQIRSILRLIGPHRKLVVTILVTMPVIAALGALEPLVLKLAFDRIGTNALTANLLVAVGTVVLLATVREVLDGCSGWLGWRMRAAVQYHVVAAASGRFSAAPFTHRGRSGIMSRLDLGIKGSVAGMSEMAFAILPGLVYVPISIALMFRLDWRLSLIVVLCSPLPALIGYLASRSLPKRAPGLLHVPGRIFYHARHLPARAWGRMTCRSGPRQEAFAVAVDRGAGRRMVRPAVGATQDLVLFLSKAVSTGCAAFLISRGEATLGTLMAFLCYQAGFGRPVNSLTRIRHTVRKAFISFCLVRSVFQEPARRLKGAPHLPGVEKDGTFLPH